MLDFLATYWWAVVALHLFFGAAWTVALCLKCTKMEDTDAGCGGCLIILLCSPILILLWPVFITGAWLAKLSK